MAMKSPTRFIPIALTLANAFCGTAALLFLATSTVSLGSMRNVALLMGLAALFDALDGGAARKFDAVTEIGRELDSLCDIISFGAVPALAVYVQSLHSAPVPGVISAGFYVCCTAFRLARHNASSRTTRRYWFTGMPVECGALVLLALVFAPVQNPWIASVLVILTGLLMASRIPFAGNVPLSVRILALGILMLALLKPGEWVLALPASYILLAVIVYPFLTQDALIYSPKRRQAGASDPLPADVYAMEFTTSQGKQTAYYLPASEKPGNPDLLWMVFHSRGSSALDAVPVITDLTDRKRAAFLLVEYPGFDRCEGNPGPTQIQENAQQALAAVSRREGCSVAELMPKVGALGVSLGCGPALAFAAQNHLGRVLLLAPFTSLADIVGLRFGPVLRVLLRTNYDNRAVISELVAQTPTPDISILHGTSDQVVPFSMSETMARQHQAVVKLVAVEGAGHRDLVEQSITVLRDLLAPNECSA